MSHRKLLVVMAVVLTCACEKPGARLETGAAPVRIEPGIPPIDLRADVNRNGVVDLDAANEDDAETTWDSTHGAIFFANLDDDSARCASGSRPKRIRPDLSMSSRWTLSGPVAAGYSRATRAATQS